MPGDHTCHAIDCPVRVPPRIFLCPTHWLALPARHKQAIWATYVRGQEVTKTPTREYLQAADQARHWLHTHETRPGIGCGICIAAKHAEEIP